MFKRKFKLFAFVLSLPLFLSAQVKTGWVDSQRIMQKYEKVRDAEIKLENDQRKFEFEFNSMRSSLDSLMRDYEVRNLMMSEEWRKKTENDIRRKQINMEKFQQEKFGPQGEISKIQGQLMQPVLDNISRVIEKVAKDRGYDYILDKSSGVLFALPQHDLTDYVLKELR